MLAGGVMPTKAEVNIGPVLPALISITLISEHHYHQIYDINHCENWLMIIQARLNTNPRKQIPCQRGPTEIIVKQRRRPGLRGNLRQSPKYKLVYTARIMIWLWICSSTYAYVIRVGIRAGLDFTHLTLWDLDMASRGMHIFSDYFLGLCTITYWNTNNYLLFIQNAKIRMRKSWISWPK